MNIAPTISEPKIKYVFQLLDQIETGKLIVPKFQRGLVWNDDQRLDLLRSIQSGLPIGSLLLWETSQHTLAPVDKIGGIPISPPQPAKGVTRTYLLDGFQRLSTLFGALKRPDNQSLPVDKKDWRIFYDLKTGDFKFQGRRKQSESTWMPVNVLLDSLALVRFWRTLKEAELIKGSDQLQKIFLSYQIAVSSMVTDDLEQATTAFKRINSSGTKMDEVDMVTALTWGENFDLREEMEKVKERLEKLGWKTLENKLILSAGRIVLNLERHQAGAENTSKAIKKNPRIFKEVTPILIRVVQFLAKCGIHSPKMLPYGYQLVLLVAVFRSNPHPNEEISQQLKWWLWRTAYLEKFSGINEANLQKALDDIRNLAKGETPVRGELTDKITPLPKRFILGTSSRAKLLALRWAERDPLDITGKSIDAGILLGLHGKEAILRFRSNNSSPENCFIVEPINSSKFRNYLLKPTDWHEDFFNSHAISPTAAHALKQGDYDNFLQERRKTLIDLEKEFIQPLGLDYKEEE
jgi:hypothetical protein